MPSFGDKILFMDIINTREIVTSAHERNETRKLPLFST